MAFIKTLIATDFNLIILLFDSYQRATILDGTGAVGCIVTDLTKLESVNVKSGIIVRNFVVKDSIVRLTASTSVGRFVLHIRTVLLVKSELK